MRSAKGPADAASSPVVNDENGGDPVKAARGAEIRRHRLARGYTSAAQFAKATGRGEQMIRRAEAGGASDDSYDYLEAWLDAEGLENGHDQPEPEVPPTRVTFKDIEGYGVGELIFEGPSDQPEQMAQMVAHLLAEIRRQQDGGE